MKKPIKKNKKTKDQWNIPSNEIERENEIGSGAYGIVYKAKVIFLILFFWLFTLNYYFQFQI